MSAPRTLVAGVDSSTQSCKLVIADPETGKILRSGTAAHPPGTEVDPEEWWAALQAAIEAAGGLDDVAALSISGQQHGLIALDAQGRVIRDALLWNDLRSGAAARELIAELGVDAFVDRVGIVPVASFTGAKLRWLRDHEPENAARVAAVALPHDWLTWRLLGYGPGDRGRLDPDLDALVTDASDASGTAYFSAVTGRYDLPLFHAILGRPAREAVPTSATPGTDPTPTSAGEAPIILPRVLGPHESAGTTPEGILLGPGAGDNAAAALGLGATAGDVVVSIGTSGTVFSPTGLEISDPTGTVAGFASADGGRLPLVATLNAARVLDSATEMLRASHEEVAALALSSTSGAGGLTLVPYFEGERTPNLPDATARLEGMTLANSRAGNVARAFVEGMLCGLADGLDAVLAQGVDAERLLLIGGAARNPAVREVARDVFTVPIDVPEQAEYVAIGAARQAAWTLTGTPPRWPVELVATLHPRPSGVRDQYHSYARAGSRVGTPTSPSNPNMPSTPTRPNSPTTPSSPTENDHRGSSGAQPPVKG
ncbi:MULTISPECIES: FGGY family carbohydrate kinase [unclassified Brevibacterium]|uniref:xylulokinase n=1 Tax=unclassified Brevibacterium TaxID=2614124 RepID=UPI001E4B20C0|nr:MULTISPECIES: FGGY family carbohydrate kinase [unclassified Brevibacterium]MCD1285656.1 xylulose kinase [Brevibacterium sp. CCUG 69071]MDK8434714.1 FGGY family carbohydrate kinase [Brevibacterium sp. H-BE7]